MIYRCFKELNNIYLIILKVYLNVWIGTTWNKKRMVSHGVLIVPDDTSGGRDQESTVMRLSKTDLGTIDFTRLVTHIYVNSNENLLIVSRIICKYIFSQQKR